jgi:hypothetical protein
MTGTYICETCSKSFKTNQHLNQHKNRKNKCKPCLTVHNVEKQNQSFDLNTTDYSVSNIIQIVLGYKNAVDKNKELENTIQELVTQINEQNYLIFNLRKQAKIVDKFIHSYTEFHFNNETLDECDNYCKNDNGGNDNNNNNDDNKTVSTSRSEKAKKQKSNEKLFDKYDKISPMTENSYD